MTDKALVIVVGVDGSDESRLALRAALDHARGRNARLHVVSSLGGYDPFEKMEGAADAQLLDLDRERKELSALVTDWASAWAEPVGAALPPIDIEVKVGAPAREILRAAQSLGAELIAVGTHGRSGLRRLVLGSVAEAVLRRAPCPVLVVRGGAPLPAEG